MGWAWAGLGLGHPHLDRLKSLGSKVEMLKPCLQCSFKSWHTEDEVSSAKYKITIYRNKKAMGEFSELKGSFF